VDKKLTIEGVSLRLLNIFKDQRGQVMHMLRSDSKEFEGFGEVYFSKTNPKIIKGWKQHLKKNQLLTVPIGQVKFVLFDQRKNSPTYGDINEIIIGEDNYGLLRIPHSIIYAFQTISNKESLIVNFTDQPHSETNAMNYDLNDPAIKYKWN
jgi:dTDP-4-dehydrorhamnose 3,5-epimerase